MNDKRSHSASESEAFALKRKCQAIRGKKREREGFNAAGTHQ